MKKAARNHRKHVEFALPRTTLLVVALFAVLLASGLALLIFV
jgi:hypothetical protein